MTTSALAQNLSGLSSQPYSAAMLALSENIDQDAELSLLQLMLIDPACREVVGHTLRGHHWYSYQHRILAETALTAEPVDITTAIGKALVTAGTWEAVGGSIYLARIIGHDPLVPGTAADYCQRIRAAYRARETLAALREAVTRMETGEPVDAVLDGLAKRTKGARL